MKNIYRIIVGTVFIAAVLHLSSCGKKEVLETHTLNIGVACYNQSDTYLGELIDVFKKKASDISGSDLEITVTLRDAAGSQRTQDDQVKELIDAGCRVLCVNLVDRSDPSTIIDMARERDIPIIFFNREPVAEDLMQWEKLYYVGADAKQSGVLQGEMAAEAIRENSRIDRNKDGKIQYVILEGEAGHQDAIIRTEKVIDTLKNEGIELEKISCPIANWNRAQAQNRMLQIINEYQSKVEIILANNDDMALGALDAYAMQNYTESALPVVFGIDGTEEGIQAVMDSKMLGTVYNDKEGQAEAMARLAVAVAIDKNTDDISFDDGRYIYLPYKKVTLQNAQLFLNDQD